MIIIFCAFNKIIQRLSWRTQNISSNTILMGVVHSQAHMMINIYYKVLKLNLQSKTVDIFVGSLD